MSKIVRVLTSKHVPFTLPHPETMLLPVDPISCVGFDDSFVVVVVVVFVVVVFVAVSVVVVMRLFPFPITFAVRDTKHIYFTFDSVLI